MKILSHLLLFSLCAFPVFGGEAVIVETETGITVEYTGTDEDRQATEKQNEEREKQSAKEEEKKQVKNDISKRRAEARKAAQEE